MLPMKSSPGGPGGRLLWDRVNRTSSPTPRMAHRKVNIGRMAATGVRERKRIASAIVLSAKERGKVTARGLGGCLALSWS